MSAFSSLGYGIAALGYTALFFLFLVAWQRSGSGAGLVAAALVTALWAAAQAVFAQDFAVPTARTVLLDALRYGSWLALLAPGRPFPGHATPRTRFVQFAAIAALCLGLLEFVLDDMVAGKIVLSGGAALSLLGLLRLIETYARSDLRQRRGLVYLVVGLGSIMVCDAVLYCQALLSAGSVTAMWGARGYVAGLAVPAIALAVTRGSHWQFRFAVSRDVAFYTTLATAVGGYVLLAAIGGHLLRLITGGWGSVAQLTFYLAAVVLLVVLVGSTSVRRRLKVQLVKHFFEHKYDYREEWLRFIATLSENAAGEDTRVTGLRAVAQIIASPAAVLLLKDEYHKHFTLAVTWPTDEKVLLKAGDLSGNDRLVELLERREWVVDIADQRSGQFAGESLQLPEWLVRRSSWRLILPVLFKERLTGMILLEDPPGDFSLTFEDRDLLKTAARHVATHLAQHEAEQRLAETRQFSAYSRLAAFLLHDLKNAAAQLEMVVANAARHKHNPEFIDDAIDTVANAAGRISRLIDQLGRGSGGDGEGPADVEQAVAVAMERSSNRKPLPSLTVESSGLRAGVGFEQLANIVEHMIRNAQEATPPDGKVDVQVRRVGDAAVITISDTGSGMTTAFVRDRLFRPFESTKGSKGMGIGAYQAKEFARSRGGDVLVDSEPGKGTVVRVVLPIAERAEVAWK